MRYDSWPVRLLRLAAPLAAYLLIGLLAMAGNGGYDLGANLAEKTVCACLMGYLFRKDNRKIVWKKPGKAPAVWLFAVLAGAGACIGFNELMAVAGLNELLAQDYETVTGSLYQNKLLPEILLMVIAAPLAEELLFRGLLFRRMRTYCSYLPSALITSLIFALFHGNILQGVYGFAAGILFAYAYERLRTIWAPVCLHGAANGISLLATEHAVCRKILAASPFISMLVGFGLLIVSVLMITRLAPQQDEEGDYNEIIDDSGSKL